MKHTPSGLIASLSLAGPECNAFGKDIRHLLLSVTHETESRLHVHIYDKAERQFQIPESVLKSPGGTIAATESDLDVCRLSFVCYYDMRFDRLILATQFKYDSEPFGFYIVRKRTGEIIFDTR